MYIHTHICALVLVLVNALKSVVSHQLYILHPPSLKMFIAICIYVFNIDMNIEY